MVDAPTRWPSLSSSPWILLYPQPLFSVASRSMSAAISARHGAAVEVRGTGPVLALVASELVAHGFAPLDLRVERPTVEDAFLALTGRDVRG